MMSSFRQLTLGSYSRPATDSEHCQPSAADAAADAAAGQFLSTDQCFCLLSVLESK